MPRGSSPDLSMRHQMPAIFFDRLRHLLTFFFYDSTELQPSHPVKASYASAPITAPPAPVALSTPRSRTLLSPRRRHYDLRPAAATYPIRFLRSPP
jgi:hypothetical protein